MIKNNKYGTMTTTTSIIIDDNDPPAYSSSSNDDEDKICDVKEQPKDKYYFQYYVAFSATLCLFGAGIANGWNSPSIPILTGPNSPIPMTADQGSWLIQTAGFTLLITSYPASWMTDTLGPKLTLLTGAAPLILGWVLIIFADSVLMIFLARSMFGFAYGFIFTVIPVYLGEISSDKIRGFITTLQVVMTKCGVLFVFSTAPYCSIPLMAGLSLIPCILFVLTFIWLPDSPYYLISTNSTKKAQNCLTKLRGHDSVAKELEQMENTVRKSKENKGTFHELIDPKNRRSLIIIFGLAAINPLSGSTAITDYSQTIFSKINSSLEPTHASIMLAVVQLFAATFCNYTVDTIGRKPLIILSTFGNAVCTTFVGFYFFLERIGVDVNNIGWIPVSCLMLFQITYNIGIATASYALLAEIFPINLKSIVSATFMIFWALVDIVINKLFQTVSDNLGSDVSFWTFSVCSYLFIVFVIVFVPETKGKSLDDILLDMRKEA